MFIPDAPLFINWNYTYLCNFDCRHCYSRQLASQQEVNTEQAIKICEALVKANVFHVNLGGGEPLLRNDCLRVISLLSENGIRVSLSTNAWRLANEKAMEQLDNVGLNALYVSLDHSIEEQHDAFRGQIGSFERVIRTLSLGQKYSYAINISTVITSQNYNDLGNIYRTAQKYDVSEINIKQFRPVNRAHAMRDKLELSEHQLEQAVETIYELRGSKSPHISFFFKSDLPILRDIKCHCGGQSLVVRPNGDICPCVFSDVTIGNILHDDLVTIWRNTALLKKMRESSSCLVC